MSDQHTNQLPLGSSPDHGAAHENNHRQWSRRSFLRSIGITGGVSLMAGNMPLMALKGTFLEMALANSNSDRILVLIRLKGGNDGLNTIIPVFDYGTYQSLRPQLRVPLNQTISLDSAFSMPQQMSDLQPLWLDGAMKVVHGVGYPDQNLSHFRSSDIWASASPANVVDDSGWLGRLLMEQYPDYLSNPPLIPPAVQIGGVGNISFMDGENVNLSVSVTNPNELAEIAQLGRLYDVQNLPDCFYGEQLGYLRTIANSTFIYAQRIKNAFDNSTTDATYQTGSLWQQLALVARLIKGGLGTQLYMVTLDGFDTHAAQSQFHPLLLAQLAGAVRAFYQDLATAGRSGDVLCMTQSEFGRRPEQNASQGTDHGAAAPLFLFGEGLNGNGFVGTAPSLQNLDNDGNLVFSTDFRRIYATVLENWLCIAPDLVDGVMGQHFARLPLGLNCAATGIAGDAAPGIPHEVRYISGREVVIAYQLPSAAMVRVEVFNVLGQPVTLLANGYQMSGRHEVTFSQTGRHLPAGQYVYRISAGESAVSRSVRLTGH